MIRLQDLGPYLCPDDLSTGDALARLNQAPNLFQLIIGTDNRLLGTLTDGDVRRGLLRGTRLEDPVRLCMHTDFIVCRQGEDDEAVAMANGRARQVDFVPVVDQGGRLVHVLIQGEAAAGIRHALVMAGGFGRRLGAKTRNAPKPLLLVGGRPILDHVLSTLEEAGVGNAFVSVHYLGDQIKQYLANRENRIAVDFVEEDDPLGTAGALGNLGDLGHEPILVVNGDVITNADLPSLHDFHLRNGLDATIGVANHEVEIPFGVVQHDEQGLFLGIEEKPRLSNFIAAGIYYLGPDLVRLVPTGQPMDMPELLQRGRDAGMKIGVFPIHEYWADVGRPADLEAADADHPGLSATTDDPGSPELI